MKQHTQATCKRVLALCMSVLMLMTAWVFVAPTKAAAEPDIDVWQGGWSYNGFENNHIRSADAFAQFIRNVGTGTSYSGQTIYLDIDINLNEINFGNGENGSNVYYDKGYYFEGTFDGQGHTIYEFRMTNDDHRVAMFRSARNATFKNLTVDGIYVDDINNNGRNGFAVMVGYGDGNLTFENVHLKNGIVYGYNYVGGLVGEYGANNTLRITNCTNNVTIHADNDRAGGMVGHAKGSVIANGCTNEGEIYAGYSDAGGIAGWIEDDESSFVNCTNTAKVSTDACAGGIVGYFGSKNQDKKMTLTGCVNEGQIESRAKVGGGIAGMLDTDAEHSIESNINRGSVYGREDAGGIVGSNSGKGIWRNNKNYGSVRCDNDNAGGILGDVEDDQNKFYNCYNTGEVFGKNSIGGVLGYGQNANHEFYDCGNSGAVTATSDCAGGIYGYGNESEPTIEQCWNIGTVKAYNDAGGILGRTYHHSYIRRCWNAGSIETYNHDNNGAHGGIAGQTSDKSGSSNSNPNMTDCFNWGPVSGGRDDGGLIGKIKDGRTPYYITNSYNAGQVTGDRPFAIIAYGGNVGNNVYYDNGFAMGTVQGNSISDGDLKNSSGFSGNYCKNTWGVKIGNTTYNYPILNWYRNMFMFHLRFVDAPSGTNAYWDGEYKSSFYAINPTRRGYTTDHWFLSTDAGKTIAIPTEIITCGITPCTDSLLMTQSFSEVTDVSNDSTFNLTWEKIKQKLDMNAVLNGEYKWDNIDFFTADVYVNGVRVADDVNDFYEDLQFEDTYEITDIKAAEGYRFIGAYSGTHDGRQQSGLTGQMDLDLIEVAPEFRTLHTVTVTPGTGTTISGVENGTYAWGDTVTVTAAAQTGYDQSTPVLKVNGSAVANGSEITITGDTTITTDALNLNTYTVNFYNGDPDTPYASQTYTHGEAFAAPENPTFSDDTDADYRFVGWAAAAYPDEGWDTQVSLPETVTANADYYSLYDGYVTVTWKNGDEIVAGPDSTMVGTMPVYDGDMPTTADAQYTYTAIGWNTDPDATEALDPLPALGKNNVTYYAVYDKTDEDHRTINSYPVTISAGDNTTLTVKNGDTVISSGAELPYGTVLTIEATPAAAYSQSGVVIKVNGEALTGSTCTVTGTTNITTDAIDAANINTYTVTWVVNNETVETDENVTHGTLPSYDGETPTKSDAQYTYAFTGWDGDIEAPITADTTFIAQFSDEGTVNSYKIKFVYVPDGTETVTTSEEETLDYGAAISFPATAASYRDKADVKTFAKWIDSAGNEVDPASTTVSKDETYTAFYDTETGTARYTRTVIAVLGEEEYTTLYQNNNMQYGWASALSIDPPADIRKEAQIWRFRAYSDDVYPGLAVPVLGDKTFYAYFDLTDEAAKYKVTFLNDDNYTKIAEAEYEYGAAVNVPAETPVSTNRTKELDYTFLGWTPQVSETVTADVTYVATYETEAHSRIYHVKWVYGADNTVAKEADLPYNTVFTAEHLPADVIVQDDDVTHYSYNWSERLGTALADHIGYSTTEVVITASYSIDRHTGTPAYEWVGSDAEGYTKCIATMTCTDCGEELRVEYTLDEDDVYTHTGEHCQDQSYTTYRAWIAGSGVNSYFENKVKTVYGAYGDHFYPSSMNAVVWNTEDVNNVTCKVTQTCHYCGHVEEHPGVVSPYEQTPATCATPEKTIFVAEFDGWVDQYSEEIETAPIDPDAHNYDGWNVRPDNARSTRPVYDAATDTWSKGTLVIPCANTYTLDHDYDPETGAMTTTFHYTVDDYAAHDKVLTDLDRADYEAFDEALAKFRTIGALDIADDTVIYAETYGDETHETTFGEFREMYFDRMLASAEQFPQNLVTIPEGASGHEFDEQPQVDAMTEQMQMTLELFFNEDGTVKEELLNKYTVTFTAADGTVTTYENQIKGAEVNVPAVPAEIDGCAFLGWTADGSEIAIPADTATYTVTGNAAFTAKYADTPDSYTVTFIVDGETVKTEPVSHGGSATAPEQAQYINNGENHKKFSGWIGDYTNVTADVTITATYEPEAHSWVDGDITRTPTCSETGAQAQSCVCGATNVKELDEDASNHANYGTETVGAVDAKCNADGYTGDVRCVRCHAVLETGTVISRDTVAHTPGTPTEAVIQPATCGEAGSKKVTVTCTVCGATISETTEEIPATGSHSWGWVTDTDADCGNAGVKHEECAVCHETRSEGTVIPATGNHTPGEPARENEVPATCSAEGSYVEVITCTVCGEELSRTTRTIEKKAHTPGDPTRENETAATCTEAASYVEVIACAVCGDVISRTNKTEGSALGHDFGDWSQTVAPTCDGAGQESRTCARCTLTETRPVAKLGHAWGEWAVTKEATCSETGTRTRTCGNDPAHTETETIPMIAHTDADGDNVCDNCGATIKQPFRCGMCPTYEKYKEVPVVGWFVIVIHFFVHLAQQISHWT